MIEGGGKVKSAQSSLSDKCSLMCSLADSSRTQMMKEINDGSVTFRDMEFFLEKQNEIEKLCTADDTYKVPEVQVVLRRRRFECTTFRDYKAKLDSFCSKLILSKLQVTGMSFVMLANQAETLSCNILVLYCELITFIAQGSYWILGMYICIGESNPHAKDLKHFEKKAM